MSRLFQQATFEDFPLSRSLLISLLLVYAGVLWLHFTSAPIWLLALGAGVIVWRINILRERWRAPGIVVKVIFMLLAIIALRFEYQQWLAIEPMITLLLVALSLKLLEIRHRRDFLIILLLSYFAIASSFLFSQDVVHSLWGLLVVIVTTATLSQLYAIEQKSMLAHLRLAGVMLLQSIALMLLMLLVLPRVNPLWSVPLHSDSGGMTGISDSMSPGDFDQLIRSNELALRVTVNQGELQRRDMYWRGLVFDAFDGRRWQRTEPVSRTITYWKNRLSAWQPATNNSVPLMEYEVLMEPTGQHWLFGIPTTVFSDTNDTLIYTRQQETFRRDPVHQRIKYQAKLYRHGLQPSVNQLTAREREYLTYLPKNLNPKAQAQAQSWRDEASSNQAYIQRVLAFYQRNFTYTLSPPKLGQHTVDEFLFSSQQGFCEHFSSSFVVLMRSVGIPARIVVGYQGGTWSEDKSYLSVYQRDAHAWAEVWLDEQGWVRVDPTAAVAALRIEQGLEAALPEADRQRLTTASGALGWISSVGIIKDWVNAVALQWRELDYRWQNWVLSYDSEKQQNFLKQLFGDITPAKMIMLVLAPFMVIIAILGLTTFRHLLVPEPMEVRLYQRLSKKLGRLGVEAKAGESISDYCRRAASLHPHLKPALDAISQEFEKALYAQTGSWEGVQAALKRWKS